MIVFTVDDNGLIKTIANQLGEYHDKAPTVLKQALNATAKDARSMLAEQAKEIYVIQKSRFNKAMEFEPAKVRTFLRQSQQRESRWNSSTSRPTQKYHRQAQTARKSQKGKVLTASGLKRLEVGNIKAFVAKFSSGHVSIVQRRTAARLPIKKLLSPSIPKMIGNEKEVYGKVQPEIAQLLDENIRKYIAKTIERGRRNDRSRNAVRLGGVPRR